MKKYKFDFWKAIIVNMLSIVFLVAMFMDIDTMTIWTFIFLLFVILIFNAGVWTAYFRAKDMYETEEWIRNLRGNKWEKNLKQEV